MHYDSLVPCNEPVRRQFQFYTDSLSMMKKLKAYEKYPTAPLTKVLHSEWGVLSALHRALKWFVIYPKNDWVKSHQDDKVYTSSDMPLDAYLNSEADELATTGLKVLQEKPLVPLDPDTAIQFHIGERTITREFKRSVREIITLRPHQRFYCEKFRWNSNTFDSIDWDIFRPVYKRYTATHGISWMHKFLIGKLPTGERIRKRVFSFDQRCASCWHQIEDDDHFICCPTRRRARIAITKQVDKLRNIVDPNLCNILKEGI
jgi:hypothetical protein